MPDDDRLPRALVADLLDAIHADDPGAIEAWADGRDDVAVSVDG